MDNRENLYRMIAGNIRKERERLYITQAELAARLDYSANASCSGSRTGNLVFGGQADGDRAGFGSDYGLSFVWDNGSIGGTDFGDVLPIRRKSRQSTSTGC